MVDCHTDLKLRVVQVILVAVIFISGLTTCLSIGWTTSILGDKCVLFSSMSVRKHNGTIVLDLNQLKWGEDSICAYCTYISVVGVIYAVIYIWFFILVSKWKRTITDDKGSPPDMVLLAPSLVFNVAILICVTVSTLQIMQGRRHWCNSITKSLNRGCSEMADFPWVDLPMGRHVYWYLIWGQMGSWILFGSLLANAGYLGMRLKRYKRYIIAYSPITKVHTLPILLVQGGSSSTNLPLLSDDRADITAETASLNVVTHGAMGVKRDKTPPKNLAVGVEAGIDSEPLIVLGDAPGTQAGSKQNAGRLKIDLQ